ncbi:MAG: type II secretion system F family protein, partial [Xenococcaceae cyanobacterium]
MPTFIVQVTEFNGKSSKQKIEATSAEQAYSVLKNRYATIGQITKVGFDLDFSALSSKLTKVKVKDKAVFSRQFSVMVNAGVAIVRCLGILSEQCGNPKLKKALLDISASVQQGNSLADAMSKHPECFDQLYVSMVEAGEAGGVLDEVLNRISKLLEDMARLQNQIKSAMAYPVTVGIIALAAFFGMTIFLVPIFAGIFTDIGGELPALTAFMLFLSGILRSWLVLIPIVGIIAISFLLRMYYKTTLGR